MNKTEIGLNEKGIIIENEHHAMQGRDGKMQWLVQTREYFPHTTRTLKSERVNKTKWLKGLPKERK